jgi:hypothetical protein
MGGLIFVFCQEKLNEDKKNQCDFALIGAMPVIENGKYFIKRNDGKYLTATGFSSKIKINVPVSEKIVTIVIIPETDEEKIILKSKRRRIVIDAVEFEIDNDPDYDIYNP